MFISCQTNAVKNTIKDHHFTKEKTSESTRRKNYHYPFPKVSLIKSIKNIALSILLFEGLQQLATSTFVYATDSPTTNPTSFPTELPTASPIDRTASIKNPSISNRKIRVDNLAQSHQLLNNRRSNTTGNRTLSPTNSPSNDTTISPTTTEPPRRRRLGIGVGTDSDDYTMFTTGTPNTITGYATMADSGYAGGEVGFTTTLAKREVTDADPFQNGAYNLIGGEIINGNNIHYANIGNRAMALISGPERFEVHAIGIQDSYGSFRNLIHAKNNYPGVHGNLERVRTRVFHDKDKQKIYINHEAELAPARRRLFCYSNLPNICEFTAGLATDISGPGVTVTSTFQGAIVVGTSAGSASRRLQSNGSNITATTTTSQYIRSFRDALLGNPTYIKNEFPNTKIADSVNHKHIHKNNGSTNTSFSINNSCNITKCSLSSDPSIILTHCTGCEFQNRRRLINPDDQLTNLQPICQKIPSITFFHKKCPNGLVGQRIKILGNNEYCIHGDCLQSDNTSKGLIFELKCKDNNAHNCTIVSAKITCPEPNMTHYDTKHIYNSDTQRHTFSHLSMNTINSESDVVIHELEKGTLAHTDPACEPATQAINIGIEKGYTEVCSSFVNATRVFLNTSDVTYKFKRNTSTTSEIEDICTSPQPKDDNTEWWWAIVIPVICVAALCLLCLFYVCMKLFTGKTYRYVNFEKSE